MRGKIGVAAAAVLVALILAVFYRAIPAYPAEGDGPLAVAGQLDLSGVGLDDPVRLDGEWLFYADKLLTPDELAAAEPSAAEFVRLPEGLQRRTVDGGRIAAVGYGTLRLRIRLPENTNGLVGIKIMNIKTSHRLFANGIEIGRGGKPGTDERTAVARNIPYAGYFHVAGGYADIVLQTANFSYYLGGVTHPIYFGMHERIMRLEHFYETEELTVAAGFMLTGIYLLVLFLMRRQERAWLFFGLYAMLCGALILTQGEKILGDALPSDSYEWFIKCQFILSFLAYGSFMLYVHLSAPGMLSDWAIRTYVGLIAVGTAIALTVPLVLFSRYYWTVFAAGLIGIVYMLYASVRFGIRRGSRTGYIVLGVISLLILYAPIGTDAFGLGNLSALLPPAMLIAFLAQVFQLSGKIAEAFSTNERLTQRLLAQANIREEFLAHTAHEMRTPLHSMITLSQSLVDGAAGALNDRQTRNLQLIVSTGRRTAGLIHDILDLSHLRHGGLKLDRRAVALDQAARHAVETHRPLASGKDLRFVTDIPDSLPAADVDEDRLGQILSNLLSNAIKFTVRGEIRLHAEQAGDWLRVSVSDSGIGIAQEKLTAIFTQYVQVDESVDWAYGGTGLGLTITRRLVELHGGTISAVSEPGRGSVFAFTLPIAAEAAPRYGKAGRAETAAAREALPERGDAPEAEAANVLVVDDDAANRQALLNVLATDGYRALAVAGGEHALRELEERRFDLVILDLMMPGLPGDEVCRRIRAKWSLPELPVLLLTARSRPEDRLAGFEAGANDYLGKPVEPGELKARIRTLIGMKRSAAELAEAEMAFLRAQIKPHFLFNALSTVISVAESDVGQAQELLVQLSNYLRSSFDFHDRETLVPLQKELELVRAYLRIESARFGERLKVEYEIGQPLSILIPPLTVQPLVENAVRHGIMKKEEGGKIRISIRELDSSVAIEIEDDGVGMSPRQIASIGRKERERRKEEPSGVGLQNIHDRLRKMYGRGLKVEAVPGGGTRVRFAIPIRYPAGKEEESSDVERAARR